MHPTIVSNFIKQQLTGFQRETDYLFDSIGEQLRQPGFEGPIIWREGKYIECIFSFVHSFFLRHLLILKLHMNEMNEADKNPNRKSS